MPVEFTTEAQKATYDKAAGWIKDIFGDFAAPSNEYPSFGIAIGSSWTTVSVVPWDDTDAVVYARSWVVTEVEMTPDLMHYLLQENDNMRFGAFGIDSDEDIFLQYSIVGSTMDREELKALAMAVCMTADRYDDEIVSRWGGQRATDRQQ